MPESEPNGLSLTGAHAEFVASCIASGRYASEAEVVRAGLRLLEDEQARRDAELERLRRMAASGLAQIERGEVVDGEAVFRRLRVRRERLRREMPPDRQAGA